MKLEATVQYISPLHQEGGCSLMYVTRGQVIVVLNPLLNRHSLKIPMFVPEPSSKIHQLIRSVMRACPCPHAQSLLFLCPLSGMI